MLRCLAWELLSYCYPLRGAYVEFSSPSGELRCSNTSRQLSIQDTRGRLVAHTGAVSDDDDIDNGDDGEDDGDDDGDDVCPCVVSRNVGAELLSAVGVGTGLLR